MWSCVVMVDIRYVVCIHTVSVGPILSVFPLLRHTVNVSAYSFDVTYTSMVTGTIRRRPHGVFA